MDEIVQAQGFADEGAGEVMTGLKEGGAEESAGITSEASPDVEVSTESAERKLSWEEILADPEYRSAYNKNLQAIADRHGQEQSRQSVARAMAAREHLDKLKAQAGELEKTVPDFNLGRELNNPDFLRLTAPHTGLSLEQAYHALHYQELTEWLRHESLRSAVKSLRSGAERPAELKGGQSASSLVSDPKNMSREQREALKRRIYEAGANGRKLPFGE